MKRAHAALTAHEQPDAPTTLHLGEHIPSLDGLRGIAILVVMMLHFTSFRTFPGGSGIVRKAFGLGWTGLDLFFVLSGFLITGLLFDAKGSDRYFRTFYARRVLRILPLYYGALILVFVLPRLLSPFVPPDFITPSEDMLWYWFYLQNFHPLKNVARELIWPFWSLAIEEQFYLVWPLVIFAATRKQAIRISTLCILGTVAYRVFRVFVLKDPGDIYHRTPSRLDGLAIGSAIALLVRGPDGAALVRRLSLPVAGCAALALVLVFIHSGWNYGGDPWMQTAGYLAFPLAFGAFLCWSITTEGVFSSAMRSKVLGFFGRYSYGLYVFHTPVTYLFLHQRLTGPRFATWAGSAMGMLRCALVLLGASVACAWLSWNFYESRFLRLKRYFPYHGPPKPGDSRAEGLTAVAANG